MFRRWTAYIAIMAGVLLGSPVAFGQKGNCEKLISPVTPNDASVDFEVGKHYPAHELLFLSNSKLEMALRATFRVEAEGVSATAFLIDHRGTLITNAHVVDALKSKSSEELNGLLFNYIGIKFNLKHARVLFKPERPKIGGFDVNYAVMNLPDLAMIEVPELSNRSHIDLDGENTKIGEENMSSSIFALGNPSLGSIFFTKGNRRLNSYEQISRLISAHILPGYSGGPVLNSQGTLVGVAYGGDPVDRLLGSMVPGSKIRQIVSQVLGPSKFDFAKTSY